MKFLWGTLSHLYRDAKGTVHGKDLGLRKPHFADIDINFGKRLRPRHIENIRRIALKNGTPEQRLADGFEQDLFVATISDESRDRYGDRILVSGWNTADFRKNPVLMFGHDYTSPSVGHALDIFADTVAGVTKATGKKVSRARLRGLFLWSRSNPLAAILKGLYGDGDMRAFSVGFLPEEMYVPADEDERSALDLGEFGVLHQKQVLLENSCVPVPANPNAIQEEEFEAYRNSLPENELPGLALLAERIASVDSGMALAIRSFLPTGKSAVVPALPAPIHMDRGVVPSDVSKDTAPRNERWSKPTLADFTDAQWEDLSNAEKRRIMGHFAWADASPASSFGALSLPHHRPSDGAVVFAGLAAAAARMGQTAIPSADLATVKAHLRRHYAAFDETPPDSLKNTDAEVAVLLAWAKTLGEETYEKAVTAVANLYIKAMEGCEYGEDCPMEEGMDECPAGKKCPMENGEDEASLKVDAILAAVLPQFFAALVTPEGDLEDAGPGDGATSPESGDIWSDIMADLQTMSTEGEGEAAPAGVIPKNVTEGFVGDKETEWTPLTAEEFVFDKLNEEERATVAGFFAWAQEIPPKSFDQLKLGHHRKADGFAVWAGVVAAMHELLSGATGLSEEDIQKAYDHLAEHYRKFEEEPPALRLGDAAGYGDGSAESGRIEDDDEEGGPPEEKKGLLDKREERHWRVVRSHKPKTAPEDATMTRADWDKAVGTNVELRRDTCLIYDANDPKNPAAYLMHHHLPEEGTPVVWKLVQRQMRLLLGRAVDSSITESVRRRAYFHLRTHYEQFEKESPAFRSMQQLAALGQFLIETARSLAEGDEEARSHAELVLDMVFMGYQAAGDKAWEVQALKFPKASWEETGVRSWLREHAGSDAIQEQADHYLFVQRDASHFVGAFEEEPLDSASEDKVLAVRGRLKSEAGILSEKVARLERTLTEGLAKVERQIGNGGGGGALASLQASIRAKENDARNGQEPTEYDRILLNATEDARKSAEATAAAIKGLLEEKT